MSQPYAIVLFDGQCAFCDRSVKWIINHDPAARFRFVARQSALGQQLLAQRGLPPEGVESMVLIDQGRVRTHSSAVLGIAAKLPFPWKLGAAFRIVPAFIRDFLYSALARRRYRIAGQIQACSLPTPAQRSRILGRDEAPMTVAPSHPSSHNPTANPN